MKDKLLELGEIAVKEAVKLGADQAEAFLASSRVFSIEVEKGAIKSASEKVDAGCGIRSVVGKSVGYSYVTTILKDDILATAKSSVELAKVSLPDPSFASLPSFSGTYPKVKGTFDSAIKELTAEEAAELILRSVDASKEVVVGRRGIVEAQLTVASGVGAITNSLGVSGTSESTIVNLSSYVTVKEEDGQSSSFEFQDSRALKGIDPEWVGRTAAENTIKALGTKTCENGEFPVILSPLAAAVVLGGGFAGALNAEEVQFGRSYLTGLLGKPIASKALKITDNALMPNGIKSRPFDGEGFPSQKTPVIASGVLKNFLHNSYSANKEGVESTGNASRASYTSLPAIATSNFVVRPGKGKLEDLVSEIDTGVLCRYTGDRPNMTTGDLSAMVMEGFFIKGGEIQHPLRNTLIGINMRDLLQRVQRIGADTRVLKSVVSPSLVIESAKITSG